MLCHPTAAQEPWAFCLFQSLEVLKKSDVFKLDVFTKCRFTHFFEKNSKKVLTLNIAGDIFIFVADADKTLQTQYWSGFRAPCTLTNKQ